MLFNSLEFAIFLPVVFAIYWSFKKKHKTQNAFILIASYIFYGWWDWRFLSLIIFSSFVDYFVGLGLTKNKKKEKRKLLLLISIFINLGFLGFFKYFNFFTDSFAEAFTFFGKSIEPTSLNIILPVGISFYTFQTLSYSIDIYKRKLEPIKDMIAFFAFVSFFPQLVAGPIERATNLLPQFSSKRTFDYSKAVEGMQQILWGLFKKIVIADNCAEYVNLIFNNSTEYSGISLLLGAIFFAFQIYGDFSGYSDIAIGTAKLFGFNLIRNFAFPYFSRDIAEFWRRWHISLSSWFRDYLYIPLGGSRGGTLIKVRNIFIIFVISGFWHGANWTFIAWGTLHAIYFLPLLLLNKNRQNIEIVAQGRYLPSIKELLGMSLTFGLTVFAWIFFRANDITHAISIIKTIFTTSFQKQALLETLNFAYFKIGISLPILITIFIIIEWVGREYQYPIQLNKKAIPKVFRWSVYLTIVLLIIIFGNFEKTEFIYFAF